MQRIDHTTAAVALPTPAAAGSPGYFTNGDPITNTPATIVTADFLNLVQEEIISCLTQASITPSKTTRTQLRDAVLDMADQRIDARPISLNIQCAQPAEVLSVKDYGILIIPPELDGYRLTDCAACVGFPRLGGTGSLSIRLSRYRNPPVAANVMTSTNITIASGAQLRHNAVIDPLYDDVLTYDLIGIDVTAVWSGGTLGTGLSVMLTFEK